MNLINALSSHQNTSRKSLLACLLTLVLMGTIGFLPTPAQADVRKADVVYGQSVDTRGLSVAQCPSIDAEYAMVMGADGTVYFERNATSPIQIASITKIMTAIVALDAIDKGQVSLDTEITVSENAAEVGESSAGLQTGDVMTLEIALKALLVPSGNDAAVAIAETLGGLMANNTDDLEAAQAAYIVAMNEKAAELGCVDTVFENPHGLDDGRYKGNLHSCAADVAKMAQYAMKNQLFRSVVGGGDVPIVVDRADGSKATINLQTTDELIEMYEYAIGIKTGFTAAAGPSFAGAANNGELELYAIVIHSSSEPQRFNDAETLFTWVYDHIVDYKLANSTQSATMQFNGQSTEVPLIAEVPHTDWIDQTVPATLADPEAAVRIFDLNGNVSQSLSLSEVKGEVKAGDKVGTITFKQRNAELSTLDLIATQDVAAPDFFQGVGIWWDRLFRGLSGQQQVANAVTLNDTPLVVDKTSVL